VPEPLIVLDHVTKTYRSGDIAVAALRDVSLAIETSDFVAIMGTSGSGKSTLMNILGCLDRPSGGRYFLAGADVSCLSHDELADLRNRRIGFVFQSFNLLSRTSALENVELPLLYAEVPGPRRRQLARDALTRVGLAERATHHPAQLSGGQQQRVAVARALVTAPALILADEPTGNLDSRTSRDVMGLFLALVKDGMTVVLVTHDSEVADFAYRVLTLHDGEVVSDVRRRRIDRPGSTA
jgi:putative ABC transport system ATP-binding protein